ncbi:hypothetical protein NQZ79_g1741 [Umbelopsis isabellina]|nr:hypothetical protein NQZ79_g1741 [Umbelopsis isabellina]
MSVAKGNQDEAQVLKDITTAFENIRVSSPVVTASSHACDIVESIRCRLLDLVQADDRAAISNKGKECVWLLRNGRDIAFPSDLTHFSEASDHKQPASTRYGVGLLVVFSQSKSKQYEGTMEEVLVYYAYKGCRDRSILHLNDVEVSFLEEWAKKWQAITIEAETVLSESRNPMSDDVYSKFLAMGFYNEIIRKILAKTITSLIFTRESKFKLCYWAHTYKGMTGNTSTPISKVLGRESNLLKRDDISMSMTDEDRIDRGIPAGEGWRTSLMYLLAVSRKYPQYISKVAARDTAGYLERQRGHGNYPAPMITSDQLCDCGVFLSNTGDAGYGISFHMESSVSKALSLDESEVTFEDAVRLRKFVSIQNWDKTWHFEDFEPITINELPQAFSHVTTNHIIK